MRTSKSNLSKKLDEIKEDYSIRQRKKYRKAIKGISVILLIVFSFIVGYTINPNAYKARNPLLVSGIAEEVLPSIVSITTQNSSGSGIIIDESGLIVTNYHVVDNIDGSTRVMTHEKKIYPVEVIGFDEASDIAVIKIDANNLNPAKLGNSEKLKVGEEVLAIGTPFGLDSTITSGIISAKHRDRGPTVYRDFLQTDANINPGNSGGPLVNLKGEVIGINTFIISSQVSPGAGFAIPINLIKKVSESLIKDGKVSRGYLGVQVTNIVNFHNNGTGSIEKGARISGLEPNGPSQLAGLEINDTITHINNIEIENSNHLKNVVAWIPPGEGAKIKINRNGEDKTLKVTLIERPDNLR